MSQEYSNNSSVSTPRAQSPAILDAKITLFPHVRGKRPIKTLTVREGLISIQDGTYAEVIHQLRRTLDTEGDKAYRAAKEKLQGVSWCGTFPYLEKSKLSQATGIGLIDLDHVKDLISFRQKIQKDPYTLATFVSPRGDGLKILCPIPIVPDDLTYKRYWRPLARYFAENFDVEVDPSGKDISRLCFVSHDPDIFWRETAAVFDACEPEAPSRTGPTAVPRRPPITESPASLWRSHGQRAIETAVRIIETAQRGHRHEARTRTGYLLGGYVGGGILTYDEAYSVLERAVRPNTDNFESAMQTIRDCLEAGMEKPITADQLQQDYDKYLATTNPPSLKIASAASAGSTPDGSQIAETPGTDTIPLSDVYNSERLVKAYGNSIRYCGQWKKWLVYNRGIWHDDHTLQIVECAKSVALTMVREARKLLAQAEEDEEALRKVQGPQPQSLGKPADEEVEVRKRKERAVAYLTHAKSTLNARKLYNMIDLARSDDPLPVSHDELDQHHMLLPVENGVVDLQSGRLLPHDPAYLFTRRLPVTYDPQAACPIWEQALYQMMGGPLGEDGPEDPGELLETRHQQDQRARRLVTFLQRSLGYALSGVTTEDLLWILWGPGSNGKSLLINTMLTMFGEYGLKATQDLFMARKSEAHPTERANLFGRRFVATTEGEENRRLDAAFVKEATGRDPLTVRRMREDFWTFRPTHHIFMATNHVPAIKDRTHGMWRRIRLVPFEVIFHDPDTADEAILNNPRIPKQDRALPEKLLAELPGILRWCVEGCMQWYQAGLTLPEEVRLATEGYRRDMNNVEEFVREACLSSGNFSTKAKTLFESYLKWCDYNEEQGCDQKSFGKQIADFGYERRTRKGVRWYLGIAAKDIAPDEAPSASGYGSSEPGVDRG